MTEKVIASRNFAAIPEGSKGPTRATASLTQEGNKSPYFSLVLTGGCANHETILKAMPDLKVFADLHLCDDDGAPMHAEANGYYWLGEGNPAALARHLRIPLGAAETVCKDHVWAKTQKIPALVEQVKTEIEARLKDLDDFSGRIKGAVQGLLPEILLSRGEFLNSREEEGMKALMRRGGGDFSQANEVARAVLERVKAADGALREHSKGAYTEARRRFEETHKAAFVAFVDAQRLRWKMEADSALDILNKESLDWAGKYDPEDLITDLEDWDPEVQLLIDFGNGRIEEVDSVFGYTSMPLADVGRNQYYLAESSEAAGRAAVDYWRDLRHSDPKEFACLIGEKTLIAWGCGERSGPGTYQADSFEDWLENSVKEHPEGEFASYDGEELEVSISRALAAEADIEIEDGKNWVTCVAYQHN